MTRSRRLRYSSCLAASLALDARRSRAGLGDTFAPELGLGLSLSLDDIWTGLESRLAAELDPRLRLALEGLGETLDLGVATSGGTEPNVDVVEKLALTIDSLVLGVLGVRVLAWVGVDGRGTVGYSDVE